MDKKYNEDTLFGRPNSILIGDSIPEGNMTYRKGDIIHLDIRKGSDNYE